MGYRYFLFFIFFLSCTLIHAQTGIGTTTPHVSARLDVSASNKGFLPPRIALLSTTDQATIASPATGLVLFNTATAGTTPNNVLPGYYYWDGTKWNGLVDQNALQSFSGYVPNYAQSNAGSVTKNTVGDIVVSQDITSSGRPIQIIATGDANPLSASAWVQLQLFRNGTPIGKKVQAESSASNENVPYCLNYIDNPTAGTYTYSVRLTSGGFSFQFGESDGNQITLLELGAWSAGTMPVNKGGTGNSSYTTGSLLFSDGTNIAQNNSKLFWDNSNNRLGVGTNAPSTTLDINGNGNISGKLNVVDPSGTVSIKSAGFVNAGVAVTLGELQVQMSTASPRSLQVKTSGASFSGMVSAYSTFNISSFTYFSDVAMTINGSMAYLGANWDFPREGDLAVYYIKDGTNLKFWRITLMVGPGYNNNFISIERLL